MEQGCCTPIRVSGMEQSVPVLGGGCKRYVNLDNGASTPPFTEVVSAIEQFMPWYSSVHRGTGFKSMLSTRALDQAREVVLQFVGADPATHAVVFGKNTTEAINRLAQMYAFAPDDVVLVSAMEHHANDLPWRAVARVVHVGVTPTGELDMADLRLQLQRYAGRVRLVAISGASNVTGFVNPIHLIARLAHAQGARVMVDAAQLAPHRRIAMHRPDPAESLDFLALSGHKLYAPYGGGALIAPTAFLEEVRPDQWGGGAVKMVAPDEVVLAGAPDRLEPGSPNVPGAIAMAKAMKVLMHHGMENLERHEAELTAYALRALHEVPGIRIYGSADPARTADRLGVIAFHVGRLPHALVAAILAQEGAIGVRNGCFCAHPYVVGLLGLTEAEYARHRDAILRGDRSTVPGMVRASFGAYTTHADVDALVEMLHRIAAGEYREGYVLDPQTGEYSHPEFQPLYDQYFSLDV
ncbi:MAG TPA: aminotransferase class V-fold PLP-dependent enzyme [Symbiobacteriaceae bacterium]|nr:aminotransferase class V-fold PLP-dependent enzyme [Symbiobacteriaceae bacterium]